MTSMRRLLRSPTTVGLVGAIVAFVGIAAMFAFEQPPFAPPDETAHLGYAHEIAGGDVPEITSFPEVPGSATQWQAERESGRDDRYRAVWVANHPPLHYLATAPLIWLSNATDRPDGGLMLMRLANIAFAAAGVGVTYLLARDVAGGVRRIGVAAASIAALVPQGHTLFSEAMNDGLGFAATTAVVWSGVRCVWGPAVVRRRDLAVLGAAAAVAAGARSAALAVAVVVVAWVAADRFIHARDGHRARLLGVARIAAAGLLPAAVLFGWFYIRNNHLYGDFAGSQFLLDRFGRQRRGSLFEILTWGHLWVDLYHMLMSPSPLFSVKAPPGVNPVLALSAAGVAVAAAVGRTGDIVRRSVNGVISRSSLLLCVSVVAVVIITVAQHVSGGGSRYARYLLPALGVAAALVAIGLDRLLPRILPAVTVALMGFWALRNMPRGVDPAAERRPRDRGAPMPEILQVLPASPWLRTAAVVVAITGCAAIAYSLTARTGRRTKN
jgi:hypothetical protein